MGQALEYDPLFIMWGVPTAIVKSENIAVMLNLRPFGFHSGREDQHRTEEEKADFRLKYPGYGLDQKRRMDLPY